MEGDAVIYEVSAPPATGHARPCHDCEVCRSAFRISSPKLVPLVRLSP
jgi:hypothetical protein